MENLKLFTNDKGQHILMDSSGKIVGGLVNTIVEQNINDKAYCTAEFYVDLCKDEDHARSKCSSRNVTTTIKIDASDLRLTLDDFDKKRRS